MIDRNLATSQIARTLRRQLFANGIDIDDDVARDCAGEVTTAWEVLGSLSCPTCGREVWPPHSGCYMPGQCLWCLCAREWKVAMGDDGVLVLVEVGV